MEKDDKLILNKTRRIEGIIQTKNIHLNVLFSKIISEFFIIIKYYLEVKKKKK